MSRIIYSRIAWTVIALVVVITAIIAVQDVVAGSEDRELGPVVENTHEPEPSPSPSASETASKEPEQPAETTPVQPAPPVQGDDDYDDDWDDDDWDEDDDDDDWDDDWDDDDLDDDEDD